MNLFEASKRMLSNTVDPKDCGGIERLAIDFPPKLQFEALNFLVELQYAVLRAEDRRLVSTSGDPAILRNRLALLNLASRFGRAFQLPMRHAPGAAFFGGIISPTAFGLSRHTDTLGVGGRGESFQKAFQSCVGEAAEFLSFLEWDDDILVTSLRNGHGLTREELQWALAGIGLGATDDFRDLDWVEARSLVDGSTVAFPSELALRRPAAERIGHRPAESAGVGAGPTLDAAILSALSEVVERDAIGLWWFGGLAARRVGEDEQDASGFRAFARELRGNSDREVWLLDLTTDLGIPVIASLSSRKDGGGVIAGFAASPQPAQAMRNAFLEMCQMELAQELSLAKLSQEGCSALKERDRQWIERHESLSLENFPCMKGQTPVSKIETPCFESSFQFILDTLTEKNLVPYAIDLTRKGMEIPTARVLVPGLQSSKPDWLSPRLNTLVKDTDACLKDLSPNMLCPI